MKKTLLLADDSPTIQKVINLTFADEGIDVITVGDGNAAIQKLREIKPDLVVLDVHMPGLNGYQICERIRQNTELSKVPVILLVGSFEPFDEDEAKRVGADDFLMKPFQSIRQLVSRVAALLEPAPLEPAEETVPAVAFDEVDTLREIEVEEVIEEPATAAYVTDEIIEIEDVESDDEVEEFVTEQISADTQSETAEQQEAASPAYEIISTGFNSDEPVEEAYERTASMTPTDVYRSPWTSDAPIDGGAVDTFEGPESEEIHVSQGIEVTAQVDDLSDFDAEFEQKFPDAATLSSASLTNAEPVSFKDIADSIDTQPAAQENAAEQVIDFPRAPEPVVEEVGEPQEDVKASPFGFGNYTEQLHEEAVQHEQTHLSVVEQASPWQAEEEVAEYALKEHTQPEDVSPPAAHEQASPWQPEEEVAELVSEESPAAFEQTSSWQREKVSELGADQAAEPMASYEHAFGQQETPDDSIAEETAPPQPQEQYSWFSQPIESSLEETLLEQLPVSEAVEERIDTTFDEAPQRIFDNEESEPKLVESGYIQEAAGSEDAPILYDETSSENLKSAEKAIEVFEGESQQEDEILFTPPSTPQPVNYDFRSPDAFDEDLDIEENFQGLRAPKFEAPPVETHQPEMHQVETPQQVEQQPEVAETVQEIAEEIAVEAELAQPEPVIDAEPGEVSVDQADGFSADVPTEPQRAVTADDIEAIAQRVSEKLLEKLVRNLAPDMKDLIISEISGDSEKKE